MARFVSIGKYYINADRVLTVTPPDTFDSIRTPLDNGRNVEAEAKYLPDIFSTEPESSNP